MEFEFIFKPSLFILEEEKETKNVLNKIEKLRNNTSFMDSPIESRYIQSHLCFYLYFILNFIQGRHFGELCQALENLFCIRETRFDFQDLQAQANLWEVCSISSQKNLRGKVLFFLFFFAIKYSLNRSRSYWNNSEETDQRTESLNEILNPVPVKFIDNSDCSNDDLPGAGDLRKTLNGNRNPFGKMSKF